MAITTSPYINGPDILEHPTRTVKEVHLDFSSVADGCIKAGSPISAAGKVANDATAIGILLHDNYSDCGCGHGMVVVAGRIKADVAEQHSGIKISPEAKGGMPAVAFVDAAGVVTGGGNAGGPGGGGSVPKPLTYDYMPEGYPYEHRVDADILPERTVTTEGGNFFVNGVECNGPLEEGRTYIVECNGDQYVCTAYIKFNMVYIGNQTMNGSSPDTGEPFLIGYAEHAPNMLAIGTGYEAGDYVFRVYTVESTIKTIAEKFLPESALVKSWNDLTDRPFGEVVEETVLMDITVSGRTNYSMGFDTVCNNLTGNSSDDGLCFAWMGAYGSPNHYAPERLTIKFDGVEYDAERYDLPDYFASLYGDGEKVYALYGPYQLEGLPYTEHPFALLNYSTPGVFVDDTAEHRIVVIEKKNGIKTLDEKYLPAMTSPNGTKFRITVADDGTLSAVAE